MANLRVGLLSADHMADIIRDYPEMETVVQQLNDLATQLGSILNNGLRYTDNFAVEQKDVTLEPGQRFPFRVSSRLKGKVTGVQVMRTDDISDGEGSPRPIDQPFDISWDPSETGIAITGAPGRNVGKTHRLRLLMFV